MIRNIPGFPVDALTASPCLLMGADAPFWTDDSIPSSPGADGVCFRKSSSSPVRRKQRTWNLKNCDRAPYILYPSAEFRLLTGSGPIDRK